MMNRHQVQNKRLSHHYCAHEMFHHSQRAVWRAIRQVGIDAPMAAAAGAAVQTRTMYAMSSGSFA
jgi:hypothetical protein